VDSVDKVSLRNLYRFPPIFPKSYGFSNNGDYGK